VTLSIRGSGAAGSPLTVQGWWCRARTSR
jgi:hypothetical protein